MNRSLTVIFSAIVLDAVGLGLVFPIMPRLLQEVTQSQDVAVTIGIMTALYALMQFVFAPVLGALSDAFGRRPILLLSLAGGAVNYAVMAFAPQLWMLLLGRALAGLTSANLSVAMAYIADISPEDKRARRFGLFNAMFGIGFIVGPVIGGVFGDIWVRLPFLAAALLNAANFLLALAVLPESRAPSHRGVDLAVLNPFRPLRWVFSVRGLLPITLVFFILSGAGEVYGTCWVLWGFDIFRWNGLWVGLSLGAFGVCQALVQASLPGLATRRLGERGAVLFGLTCASSALAVLAFTTTDWAVFAMMPLIALGGIGTPALQALAARQVEPARQGQFQGVLASVVSLASVIGPLAFSSFYVMVQQDWPGAVWLSVVAVHALAVPLIFLGARTCRPAEGFRQ